MNRSFNPPPSDNAGLPPWGKALLIAFLCGSAMWMAFCFIAVLWMGKEASKFDRGVGPMTEIELPTEHEGERDRGAPHS